MNVQARNTLAVQRNNVVNVDFAAVGVHNHLSGVIDKILSRRVIPRHNPVFVSVTRYSLPALIWQAMSAVIPLVGVLGVVIPHLGENFITLRMVASVRLGAGARLTPRMQSVTRIFFAVERVRRQGFFADGTALHWMLTGSSFTGFSSDTSTLRPEI